MAEATQSGAVDVPAWQLHAILSTLVRHLGDTLSVVSCPGGSEWATHDGRVLVVLRTSIPGATLMHAHHALELRGNAGMMSARSNQAAAFSLDLSAGTAVSHDDERFSMVWRPAEERFMNYQRLMPNQLKRQPADVNVNPSRFAAALATMAELEGGDEPCVRIETEAPFGPVIIRATNLSRVPLVREAFALVMPCQPAVPS